MSQKSEGASVFTGMGSAEAAANYEFALQLHADMYGDQPQPPAASPDYDLLDVDYNADFALAVQMQFNDSNVEHAAENYTYVPRPWKTATISSSHKSPREVAAERADDDFAVYGCDRPDSSPSKSFNSLADLRAHLSSSRCPTCLQLVCQSENVISEIFENWKNGRVALTSRIECRNCKTSACIACNSYLPVHYSTLRVAGKEVAWCCSGGRLFLLWILLCGFDQHFLAAKLKQAKPKAGKNAQGERKEQTKEQAREQGKADKTQQRPGGRGVGFGGGSRLTHFAHADDFDDYDKDNLKDHYSEYTDIFFRKRQRRAPRITKVDDQARARSAQKAEDTFNVLVLKLLSGLLPSFDREQGFDTDPPGVVPVILLESKILNYCAELLRNDSLDDASKRQGLYNALISLLGTIGLHFSTAGLLFNERPVRSETTTILVMSFRNAPAASSETAPSLAKSLRNLTMQSNLLLQGAKMHPKDFGNTDGQNLLLLCRRISELSQLLDTNTMGNTANPTAALTNETAASAICGLPDDQILATHAFATQARALRTAPHGRMKRLITEITTLNTGLPPGIFVRYGSDRLDILKAAIIGPSGTPYENGIFEFDFFCDAAYPHKPPKVSFKTTGGGRAAFNPNLYACGKVCLSLLGTWSGEPWKPGESTLLQVLISLQAMILCEEPWFNEPGRENVYHYSQENPQSVSYNEGIRMLTVRYAILAWLDQPPPLWKDVVIHHFTHNGNKILETVSDWAKQKTSRPSNCVDYGEILASMLPELQTALRKHGATFVIPNILQTTGSHPNQPPRLISYPTTGDWKQGIMPFSSLSSSLGNSPYAAPAAFTPQPTPLPTSAPPFISPPLPPPTEFFGSAFGQSVGMGRGGTYGAGTASWGTVLGGHNTAGPAGGHEGNILADPPNGRITRFSSHPLGGSGPVANASSRVSGFFDTLETRVRGEPRGGTNRGGRGDAYRTGRGGR